MSYQKEKRQALKEARLTVSEMYEIDLNRTDIVTAFKELGANAFEKSLSEIRSFTEKLDENLSNAQDIKQIGMLMDKARMNFNWDNPLLNYVQLETD